MAPLAKVQAWADRWQIDYYAAYALLAVIGADSLEASARGGRLAAERLGVEGRRARSQKGGLASVDRLRAYTRARKAARAPFRVATDLPPVLQQLQDELLGLAPPPIIAPEKTRRREKKR